MNERVSALNARLSGGVAPAMATPLKADGYRIDGPAVNRLVDFLLAAGVSGLFVGGTTGEGVTLPAGERLYLHETTMKAVAGRVPVLVHVGANDTATALALTEHAASIQADAIVAVTPYFYPMHDDALLAYFQTLAQAAPQTPFFAYDIPQMAVNGISPALLRRLGAALPTLAGIKSSHANAQHVRQLVDSAPAGSIILAGNESIALGSLALGAHGLISGLATAVPEPFVALTRAFAAGDLTAARHHQRTVNELLPLLPAGARIGGIKQILNERGIPVGPPVPPRPTAPAGVWPAMQAILQAQGLSSV